MAGKAKKVEQIHVECGACGALNAVDKKTGEVVTYGGKKRNVEDPPTPEPDPPTPDDTPDPTKAKDDGWFTDTDW